MAQDPLSPPYHADEIPYVDPGHDIVGIYPTDLVIQSAILAGIQDLKANPWLLRYVFAGLPKDPLTAQAYGQADVQSAIKWFLSTKIPVFINTRVDTFRGTCITIALTSATEVENTLADTHWNPTENTPIPEATKPLTEPFTPGFDAETGAVTLPFPFTTELMFENMYLVNKAGESYRIQKIIDDTTLIIDNQPVVDLAGVTLQPNPLKQWKATVQSFSFRETFDIGVHEATDAYHCLMLYNILQFVLLCYRKSLFEKRGLERTKFTASDFAKDNSIDGEIIYRRFVSLEGYVRHYVPVDRYPIAQSVVENYTTSQATLTAEMSEP